MEKGFFFVRHGQTDANLKGLMCGSSWDIDINATGIAQAEEAAKILRRRLSVTPKIFSSPMLRARHTAELIARPFQPAGIQIVPELQEWNMGAWEGVPFEEVKADFLGLAEPENGESRLQLRTRVVHGLEKCRPEGHEPVIVVAHGAVWLAVQQILMLPPSKMENGIPFHVYPSGGGWTSERAV